ncbi:MAG: hypothetical protein HZB42_12195 [Sphingobacteriales bacterium]|nr:hypothetical protein [Sphingobacteriales bacterium]
MKQRILSGWNFIRILYLAAGIMILIQSIAGRQWAGIIVGAYFAAMGLFAIGCAAGKCYYPSQTKNKPEIAEAEFEEIK